jgi:hypothetical protein
MYNHFINNANVANCFYTDNSIGNINAVFTSYPKLQPNKIALSPSTFYKMIIRRSEISVGGFVAV